MPGVVLARYGGDPPRSLAVLDDLGIDRAPASFSVFVASQTLERVWRDLFRGREHLAPASQAGHDGTLHFLFHKAIRHFLDRAILTRTEERITLQRAAEAVAADADMARQLRHDVHSWRDALAEVAARGIDLATGLPPELQSSLVHPAVGRLLCVLQAKYRELQRDGNAHAFEEAAADFLSHRYRPTPHVLLEGFTHFAPLHLLLLDACARHGATVYLLYPERDEQAAGFAVMARTYGAFPGPLSRVLPTSWAASGGDLVVLQRSLFSSAPAAPPPGDGSVTAEAYSHRHQEVAACIRRIQQYLRAGYKTHDMAVVMRDSYEFQALLQEEAELQKLVDADGEPVVLSIPPRFLLLTPLGRFALALYDVWRGGSLRMAPEEFESILASGWLGSHVQATTDQFTAVQGQIFARCRTRQEWEEGLQRLRDLRATLPPGSRFPAALPTDDHIRLWGEAIGQVENLCRKLFSGRDRSIGEHIRALLNELSRLAPEVMREKEREILLRIREALLQVAESTSLPMSAAEFGEVLNGLVQEYAQEPGEEEDEKPNQIWCITPPGVDGYEKKIIFYLGVDNRRVPKRYAEPWPFYAHTIDQHQETERYLFLAVVRAAREHIHLSYAQADDRDVYRPSPYLEQSAAVLGQPIAVPSPPALSPGAEPPAGATPPLQARRPRYTIAEIAHFGLCPFRYKLETLDAGARTYRDATDAFQLGPLAQALWLNLACVRLAASGEESNGAAAVRDMLLRALEAAKPAAQNAFAGMRDLEWFTVERYARRDLASAAKGLDGHPVRVVAATPASYVIPDGDRTVQVEVPVRHAFHKGVFRYPFFGDLMREEWLLPGCVPEDGQAAFAQADGVRVFASLYHAVQWWRQASSTAFFYAATRNQHNEFADLKQQDYARVQQEIRDWLLLIEAGHYPKNPGDHCHYCPVRGECLGL
jgi:hypothetical protein